jgi:drug/metabolite transporter (DMT)-like permease
MAFHSFTSLPLRCRQHASGTIRRQLEQVSAIRSNDIKADMSSALAFAFAALVLNGLTDFAFKQAAGGSLRGDFKMHQYIVAQSLLFWISIFLYGLVTNDLKAGPHVWLGLLAGVFMFIGFNCFAWSLHHGNVSVNGPIFRLNFLVTAALAIILLGEPPLPAKLAGLAMALVAIWLLVGAGGAWGKVTAEARHSLWLAVLATLALGAGNTIHKVGLAWGGTPATQLVTHSFVYLSLSVIVSMRADGRLVLPRKVWGMALWGAVSGAAGFIAMMRGLTIGEASVIVPIAQMGLVVSAALGMAVIGERVTGRKLAGLAAAVAALAALAIS